MKYYKIMFDDENAKTGDIVCYAEMDYEEKYGIKQYDISKGEYIKNWNPYFTFYYDSAKGENTVDYMATNIGWALISPKFKQIIEEIVVDDVQICPVKIKEKTTGKEINGYGVINITTQTDALDLDNSDHVYFTVKKTGQKVLSVKKYALKSSVINGKHLVRLKEGKFATFVSEQLKERICKNGLTGCDFLEVKVV